MKYKLIISDFDGTLADTSGRAIRSDYVPVPVMEAIDKFRKAGGKFVVCSGRSTKTAVGVLELVGLQPDALIAYQGSVAYVGDKMVVNGGVKADLASKIAYDIKYKFKREAGAYISDNYYYDGDSVYSVGYAEFAKTHGHYVEKVKDLSEFILSNGEPAQKMIIAKSPSEPLTEELEGLQKLYAGQIDVNSGAPTILEIVSVDYTKYQTSKFIADTFGVSEEETVTIGDSTNDLTLIKFGRGCAVGDGSKELVLEADYVAPPIGEMPVKDIIDKILNDEDLVK